MRIRPGCPQRDVVFMAPTLEVGNGNHAIWQRLLTHLCIQTAEHGCFRLYASLPAESEELKLFKNIGFLKYCQEDIYRLNPGVQRGKIYTTLPFRRQQPNDGWGLQKLYAILTPRPVQNAEGLAQGQWALARRRWGEPGRRKGYVWEEEGELLGALHIRAGKRGIWIRTLLHPDALDQVQAMVRAALSLTVNRNPSLPVYFALRQYEVGWRSTLTDLGFEALTTRTLVVKPMTVRVRDKSAARMSALETSPSEGAATTAISRSEFIEPKLVPPNGH